MKGEAGGTARWGRVPAWWLRHPAMDADRFAVLAALATFADDTGCCHPSQATLARWLRRSRPWVNRVVAELAAEGLIEKTVRARDNGGMTSCLYRLMTHASDADVTGPVGGCDSPRQGGDRSQPSAEQNQNPMPHPQARPDCTENAVSEAVEEVAADWRPGAGMVSKAGLACPGVDLEAHTAHFVARCRAKGYRYAPARLDDAWFSWLLQDVRRDTQRRRERPSPLRTPSERGEQRLAAWAISAGTPATNAWS